MPIPITRGEASAIIAAVLWGINYPLVKHILQAVPEPRFLVIRFSAAVALLALYVTVKGEGLQFRREHLGSIMTLGLLGVGVYNILWTYGIHRTTAATAALLISTSPVFTGLYSALTGRERVSGAGWSGTALAFTGMFLIITGTPGMRFNFGSEAFLGNALMLMGSLLFSAYAIFAKPLLEYYSPTKLTTLAQAGGLLVLVPFGLLQDRVGAAAASVAAGSSAAGSAATAGGAWVWGGLAYVVVFGTIVAFALWYEGIKRTSPVRTVLFHYLVPVMSMILGLVFLHEPVSGMQVVGAVLVLLGLVLVKRKEPSRAAAERPQASARVRVST